MNIEDVENTILHLLPQQKYDIIISHSPKGEYTKHLRHEEVGNALINIWKKGKVSSKELWLFAYEDGEKKYFPKPIENASFYQTLLPSIWLQKYNIITKTYGFACNSWETQTTPRAEAFWIFKNSNEIEKWVSKKYTI